MFLSSSNLIHTTPINNNIQIKLKRFKEEFYRKRDKLPNNYVLIYKAPLDLYVAMCKHAATASVAFIAVMSTIKYYMGIQIIDPDTELDIGFHTLYSDNSDIIWFSISFMLINAGIIYATAKFPLRIYKFNKR